MSSGSCESILFNDIDIEIEIEWRAMGWVEAGDPDERRGRNG
jgi:hypothetical protein